MSSIILVLAFGAVVFFFVRACATMKKRTLDIQRLPFIADITHGVCPKCGTSQPNFTVDPHQFWQHFRCPCGWHLDGHFCPSIIKQVMHHDSCHSSHTDV